MTTGKSSVQSGAENAAAPPCKFGNPQRRKFRRACCCIGLLLVFNLMLVMHIAHAMGVLAWFAVNGSYTYKDTTYLFQPGGARSLCNDFCVDMCVYKPMGCEITSCLNVCNAQMVEYGNEDDFQQLPEIEHPIIEDLPMELDEPMYYEPMDEVETNDDGLVLVDTPTVQEPEVKLAAMQAQIEAAAEALRTLKQQYAEQCASNPDTPVCNLTKQKIQGYIAALQVSIEQYNQYAISVQVDIRVQVWMVDVDEVTAQP
mmetsp:Transcript_32856/g.52608  ORF Transcript_32856/g.52608 Transcript_32856/m.52608 type:complete len:257 (+) Transcript_32856:48-818(+)